MLKIQNIEKNSIAHNAKLRKDDIIVKFDNNDAIDMLDVAYYDCQSNFDITVDRAGKYVTVSIVKPSQQQLGIEFYDQSYIEPRWCANKCIFCFVDQLPKGQRDTLYVKDDDWRLSFVSGNYVTLSNISEKEIKRICTNKYSPLYVSVHATNDDIRRTLLGNSKAIALMPLLRRLVDNEIVIHAQIVLTPQYNDGVVLQTTMQDLYSLNSGIASLAIVPVGLTSHRQSLTVLKAVDRQLAQQTIDIVEEFDGNALERTGYHFAYCSDEMYIIADRQLPNYEYYGNFEQIENGVGLIADLNYQFDLAFSDSIAAKKQAFTLVTGVSARPYLEKLIQKANSKYSEVNVNIVSIINRFFGESITVSGLVVGNDIINQLQSCKDVADTILIPRVMLRETEDVFLDGMSLEQLKDVLKKQIIVVSDGYELCQAILECE